MSEHETLSLPMSGRCTDTAVWELSAPGDDGLCTLKITGTGELPIYWSDEAAPWHEYRGIVGRVELSEGITSTGDNTFSAMEKLTEVSLPSSLEIIGNIAFERCTALEEIKIPEGVRILGQKCLSRCTALRRVCLPHSLEHKEFKAFIYSEAIEVIRYAGTRREFDKIDVSHSSRGNIALHTAKIYFDGVSEQYVALAGKIRGILENNGDGKLHVIYPDVTVRNTKAKSGDCALIIFPNGKTMFIDTGYWDNRPPVFRFIRKIGIKRLDWLVSSHSHGDHLGNSLQVCQLICEEMGGSVGAYLSAGCQFRNLETPIMEYLSGKGAEIRSKMREGDHIQVGEVGIEFFGPSEETAALYIRKNDSAINNTSLVMKFTFGKSSYMTSGDLYAGEEMRIASVYGERLRSDVMKANHHARYTSNSPEWIAAVSPKCVLAPADDIGSLTLIERLKKQGIKHYSAYDAGLMMVTFDADGNYSVETADGDK